MNPAQRNAALIFLAAIAVVVISQFAGGKVTLILVLLLIIGMLIPIFKRGSQLARSPVSTLTRKLIVLCVVTSIGYFAINEFEDIQSRRLILFNQAVTAIQASSEANHLLGSPIRVSWPVKATGNLSNERGETHLLIPVSGTQGYAKVVADGLSVAGAWKITNLQLVQNGTVTTLEPAPPIH
jgi:hypothetical protein